MASNKRRRLTQDQIIRKLAEGNKLLASGQELDEMCRHLQIAGPVPWVVVMPRIVGHCLAIHSVAGWP